MLWLLAAMFFTGCCCAPFTSLSSPPAQQGMLDLRSFTFEHAVVLEGTWLAAAMPASAGAPTAFDAVDGAWRPASIPSFFSQQGFPNEGMVYYRLHLRLPADAPPLKGFLEYAGNAYRLYAAQPGKPATLVAASGRPAATAEATVRSRQTAAFTLPADTALVLTWQVANHGYLDGGPYYAIHLGSASVLDAMLLGRTALIFAGFGLYVIIGGFFLLAWAWHRHDTPALAVGLIALAMGFRQLVTAGMLEAFFPLAIDYALRIRLEAISFLVLLGLFAFMLWSFFPKEFRPLSLGPLRLSPPDPPRSEAATSRASVERRPLTDLLRVLNTVTATAAIGASVLLTAVTLLASPLVVSYLLAGARWFTLLLILPGCGIVIQALLQRRSLAPGVALGLALVLAGSVHDVFVGMGLLHGHTYLVAYAFVGFVLVQGYAVAARSARHTAELHTATLAAQEASRAKSQFLNAVSHELRTPLTAIIGYAHLLQEEVQARLAPHEREFVSTIRESSDRLLHLVNDLLDLSKAETGHLPLSITDVPLQDVVRETIHQIYPLAENKQLTLTVTGCSDALQVRADRLRLRQVLINLLSNAIKFTEQGGVTLHVEPSTLRGPQGNALPAVALQVRDTGSGISPAFMPYLFDPFSQELPTKDGLVRGTGLGLAIAHELATRMDGTLTAQSPPGSGATFTLTLPAVPQHALAPTAS